MEMIAADMDIDYMRYATDMDTSNQHKLDKLPGRGTSKGLDGYCPSLKIAFEWHPFYTHGTPNNADPDYKTIASTTATDRWERTRAIMDSVVKHADVDFLAYLWMDKPPTPDKLMDHLYLHVPGTPDCSLLAKDHPPFMRLIQHAKGGTSPVSTLSDDSEETLA